MATGNAKGTEKIKVKKNISTDIPAPLSIMPII
jgi:hypothetical protein